MGADPQGVGVVEKGTLVLKREVCFRESDHQDFILVGFQPSLRNSARFGLEGLRKANLIYSLLPDS